MRIEVHSIADPRHACRPATDHAPGYNDHPSATTSVSYSMSQTISSAEVIARTQLWLDRVVIGLNLCPFAKSVRVKDQIRFTVSTATKPEALAADLVRELELLRDADPEQLDTTLLIHPDTLTDFLDFNDFLSVADRIVQQLGLEGEIQIASFHPDYQFAGTEPDDPGNYTNRAPFPSLHLLREQSIERAVNAIPDAADIFEKNIETMHRLGHAEWLALMQFSPPRQS